MKACLPNVPVDMKNPKIMILQEVFFFINALREEAGRGRYKQKARGRKDQEVNVAESE